MNFFTKVLCFHILIFFLAIQFVSAEEYNRKGYSDDLFLVSTDVTQEQQFKNFFLEFLHPKIVNAAQKKYNDKSISGISVNWENTYNVVEITRRYNQGNEHPYPYVISVIVFPQNGDINNPKIYGPDKLTFGIDPILFRENISNLPAIKLIDYKHIKTKP
ncbi:DUF3888 domain-containing protein [Cytobacillus sp. Bac17]|uniref:DUF3888 domain-containing protein n=1 Tax=Cytobacillus sp. Bac17 TaxID=2926008 RepID=UPI0021178178|nr:DUF3888 domain-containing protein [Cytobacillus sp. Bac17]